MDSDIFSTEIVDRSITLETAADVARFSFVVQDSISFLDLALCKNSKISDYFRTLDDSFVSRRLRRFVNTEEKCRQFFAPRRRLFYTLHLDLPNSREGSLKFDIPEAVHYRRCTRSPHIAEITLTCGFHSQNMNGFIEEAMSINFPKVKILEWILKVPFTSVPLLSRLDIRTTRKFIDCFYPMETNSTFFEDFITQFDIIEWAREYEDADILEYLLYHARRFGNLSLDENPDIELINSCILNLHYSNIDSLFKYKNDCMPTDMNYGDYLHQISTVRPLVTEDVIEKAEESVPTERLRLIVQFLWLYIESHIYECTVFASEVLRLIWCSIPDAYITYGELERAFGEALSQELVDMYEFYCRAVGKINEYAEPRSLTHLCRTVLRRTFEKNDLWLPDAIIRTGLPKSVQSFLNLEE